ncbi:hypothetical protein [Methylosinus sporium]|uniref:Uncharacterized protein n=1 Tax=Methylosinus sporium TaxID=428 RepID=A0A2U1SMY7_METSR|nr:hypothetical protein [Methylosinus sporium]PWB92970.1 hypothetical protein C5689_15355 [Methylosinus sporium]
MFEGERDHLASSPLNAGEARLLRRAISPGKGRRAKKPLPSDENIAILAFSPPRREILYDEKALY